MNVSSRDALELCRSLLAFSAPGMAVAVPHAALAQLVELAAGVMPLPLNQAAAAEPLQELFDVAALAKRYNRAPPTVRQWFHDGLFGPPEVRRFRGRGYVAPANAVLEFEARTGLRAMGTNATAPGAVVSADISANVREPEPTRKRASQLRTGGLGGKIFAAQGGRIRRSA